jgi:hypothetical protein
MGKLEKAFFGGFTDTQRRIKRNELEEIWDQAHQT